MTDNELVSIRRGLACAIDRVFQPVEHLVSRFIAEDQLTRRAKQSLYALHEYLTREEPGRGPLMLS